MADSPALHQSLRNQSSLEELILSGKPTDLPSHNTVLIQSLCRLTNLKMIDLKGVSDNFTSEDIITIATHLPNLWCLWTTGRSFDDSIWESISANPKLRRLYIEGRGWFTVDGMLDFASRVKGRGFCLEVTRQDEEVYITEEEQDRIDDALRHNGCGFFYMETFRKCLSSEAPSLFHLFLTASNLCPFKQRIIPYTKKNLSPILILACLTLKILRNFLRFLQMTPRMRTVSNSGGTILFRIPILIPFPTRIRIPFLIPSPVLKMKIQESRGQHSEVLINSIEHCNAP